MSPGLGRGHRGSERLDAARLDEKGRVTLDEPGRAQKSSADRDGKSHWRPLYILARRVETFASGILGKTIATPDFERLFSSDSRTYSLDLPGFSLSSQLVGL